MKFRLGLSLLLVVFLAAGCAGLGKPPPVGDRAPVIEDVFASPTVPWGRVWKVYVQAHDPDGDLWEVQFDARQPGMMYGSFEGHVILSRTMWRQIDGFFYFFIPWDAFRMGIINADITMRLVDRGGRKSRDVLLPLNVGVHPQVLPPKRFTRKRLLHIPLVIRTQKMEESIHFRRLFFLKPLGPNPGPKS